MAAEEQALGFKDVHDHSDKIRVQKQVFTKPTKPIAVTLLK